MRKYLNNGFGTLVIIILAIIGGAIAVGELRGKVKDNTALASDNGIKIEKASIDIAVEKEKTKSLTESQKQYSNDMKMNSSFQAGQLVETSHIKADIKEIKELLRELANK